jgi:hypothetical protein
MNQREMTAFHEAGHFVLGLVKFFNEPSYSAPIHLCIDKFNDNKGQLKGFSFYTGYTEEEAKEAGNPSLEGYPNYPEYSRIKNKTIEIDKLKKEAIQTIGGLLSEHLYCNKNKPSFEGNDDNKYSSDLKKYELLIKAIYGTNEHLYLGCLDDDYTKAEELLLEKSDKLWTEALLLISKKPKIADAIEFVKDMLLKQNEYKGADLTKLVSDVKLRL